MSSLGTNMATAAEIRNKAAKKCGLVGTGQTLQSNISADFDDAYTEVYAELQVKGLATWGAAEEVPSYLVEPVVAWVAGVRAAEYSIPPARYERVMRDYLGDPLLRLLSAEARIRSLQATPRLGETEIVNY